MSVESTDRTKAPKAGLAQLFSRAAVRSLVHQPRWFVLQVIQAPRWWLDQRKEVGPEPFSEYFASEAEAVSTVLGVSEEEYRTAVASLWTPERDPTEPFLGYAARKELLNLVGGLVALMRPKVVVETGVALGFTTATILAAMREEGDGQLYSVDLPPVQYGHEREIGSAVPAELRDRWTLRQGASQKLLPSLLREVAPVDVFIHDSNHAYSAQLREYRTAWPHLRSGGVLVSDDVGNPAFVEFAAEVGARPYLVPGSRPESAVGLLRKN
jgi:predicted O-methyltransferase YrrM